MITVSPTIQIPLDECHWTFVRASGPGGQNVNKVASKVVLRWSLEQSPSVPDLLRTRFRERFPTRLTSEGDVIITSQLTRDRERNRTDCVEKLTRLLQLAMETPKKRLATKPSRGSKERRLTNKKQNSEKKSMRRTTPTD